MITEQTSAGESPGTSSLGTGTLRARVVQGFGWVATTTVGGRLVQVAAAALVTRMLQPEDFGLLAVVTAVCLFVDRVSTFGLDSALVQRPQITLQMMNVAWSYQLARNVLIGLLVIGAAPGLAAAFGRPEAAELLRVAALTFPLAGLRNIGLVRLRRALDFRRLGYVDLIPIVVYALTMVALTAWLRSVWALVYASVVLALAGTVVSYAVAPHWPRLDFTWPVARPLFGFGFCLLGNTVLQMLREQGAVFVLARTASVSQADLGFYNRGAAFSLSLLLQGQSMFWRVVYPAMAAVQSDPQRLRVAWIKAHVWLAPASLLFAGLFAWLSAPVVRLVLGETWLPIVPVMQAFGVYAAVLFVSAPSEVLFQAIGRPGLGTALQVASTALLALALFPAIRWNGVAGAAWAFAVSAAVLLPVTMLSARNALRRLAAGAGAASGGCVC